MNIIPDKYRDLLDRPIVVSLATLMNEGPPQVQPVWCNFDGTHILVNTEKGRQKYRNMSRRPSVTILAIDPDNADSWVMLNQGGFVKLQGESILYKLDSRISCELSVPPELRARCVPFQRKSDKGALFLTSKRVG